VKAISHATARAERDKELVVPPLEDRERAVKILKRYKVDGFDDFILNTESESGKTLEFEQPKE